MSEKSVHQDVRPAKAELRGNEWMLTFADLLSLLLTFFVLMFSMSIVKIEDWQSLVESMSSEFNPERIRINVETDVTERSVGVTHERGLNLTYLTRLLERSIVQDEMLSGALIGQAGDEVIISLPAALVFRTNSLQLKPGAEAVLELLTSRLVQIPNRLKIAGHAVPSLTGQYGPFRSSWELTLARSRIVAKILKENGYRRRLSIVGYGDSRFGALNDSLPLEERQVLADRIDIVVIEDDGTGDSPRLF